MAKIREVKISSRTIYSKYCEIYIEIPKDLPEEEVSDWLEDNEDKWTMLLTMQVVKQH